MARKTAIVPADPTIHQGMLATIAKELAEVVNKKNELEKKEDELKNAAKSIMIEQGMTSERSLFGLFSLCGGKTSITYTSEKYKKLMIELEVEKVRAKAAGKFIESKGEPYVRFIFS
jgi:hypothetical protein